MRNQWISMVIMYIYSSNISHARLLRSTIWIHLVWSHLMSLSQDKKGIFSWWNLFSIYWTYNLNGLYFWRSTPQNTAFSNQNKDHLCSRYHVYLKRGGKKTWLFSKYHHPNQSISNPSTCCIPNMSWTVDKTRRISCHLNSPWGFVELPGCQKVPFYSKSKIQSAGW